MNIIVHHIIKDKSLETFNNGVCSMQLICKCCGKSYVIPEDEISDHVCSDACWEKLYAPGPLVENLITEEELQELKAFKF